MSVGTRDVHVHREGWERGGREVGEGTRMPVGRVILAPMPRKAATWRCCSGRERTALRGTSGLAPMPRKAATWRCCSGRARTALRGTRILAPMPRKAATWRCCSGRERTDVRGTSGLAPMPREAATWRCCSGRARTALRGTMRTCRCRGWRPPGGATVGAQRTAVRGTGRLAPMPRYGGHLEVLQWARANGRSVGRADLRQCRGRRPPGGVAVGARERRSVGRGTCAMPRMAATWRCCSGRARTALRGTSGLAPMPRVAATWRCCSGRARTALRGTSYLRLCRGWRPPGGAAVGARERLLRGTRDLPPCRGRRPPGGAAVGASERRPWNPSYAKPQREPQHEDVLQWIVCGGRRGGVVARRRCAARRGVCFFSPRHAQSATARRVRVRVALVVDRVVAMRFASLARSSATAPVSFVRSLPRVVVRSVVR